MTQDSVKPIQVTAFKDTPKLSTNYYVKRPRTMSGPPVYSNHLPPQIVVTLYHDVCKKEKESKNIHASPLILELEAKY